MSERAVPLREWLVSRGPCCGAGQFAKLMAAPRLDAISTRDLTGNRRSTSVLTTS